jgi:hypothetical protein
VALKLSHNFVEIVTTWSNMTHSSSILSFSSLCSNLHSNLLICSVIPGCLYIAFDKGIFLNKILAHFTPFWHVFWSAEIYTVASRRVKSVVPFHAKVVFQEDKKYRYLPKERNL